MSELVMFRAAREVIMQQQLVEGSAVCMQSNAKIARVHHTPAYHFEVHPDDIQQRAAIPIFG